MANLALLTRKVILPFDDYAKLSKNSPGSGLTTEIPPDIAK